MSVFKVCRANLQEVGWSGTGVLSRGRNRVEGGIIGAELFRGFLRFCRVDRGLCPLVFLVLVWRATISIFHIGQRFDSVLSSMLTAVSALSRVSHFKAESIIYGVARRLQKRLFRGNTNLVYNGANLQQSALRLDRSVGWYRPSVGPRDVGR